MEKQTLCYRGIDNNALHPSGDSGAGDTAVRRRFKAVNPVRRTIWEDLCI